MEAHLSDFSQPEVRKIVKVHILDTSLLKVSKMSGVPRWPLYAYGLDSSLFKVSNMSGGA